MVVKLVFTVWNMYCLPSQSQLLTHFENIRSVSFPHKYEKEISKKRCFVGEPTTSNRAEDVSIRDKG